MSDFDTEKHINCNFVSCVRDSLTKSKYIKYQQTNYSCLNQALNKVKRLFNLPRYFPPISLNVLDSEAIESQRYLFQQINSMDKSNLRECSA